MAASRNLLFAPGLLTAVLLSTASSHALAQPAEGSHAATPRGLEEIVVTAQRREQSLRDVGMTVTALDSDYLASRQIDTAIGLSKVVSAFSVTEAADGTPVFTLRGVGFNSPNLGAQPTVSIYNDEAPLAYMPMAQGPLFDLDRVEVLKGPQGTLYGGNTTGGAINYIAAKPTQHFDAGFETRIGRFQTVRAEGFVSGPLSDTASARLALTGTRSDDWQDNYVRDDSHGAQKKFAGRLLLDWNPADAVAVSFNLNGWVDQSDNQIPLFIEPAPRVPVNADPELLAFPSSDSSTDAAWDAGTDFSRDNNQVQGIVRIDVDLADRLVLTSLSNYVRVNIDSRYDNDATALDLADVTTTGRVEMWTQELRLSGTFGDGMGNFIVGANYQTDDVKEGSFQRFNNLSSTVNIASPPLPPPGLGSITESENRGNQSNDIFAIFGNVEWDFTEQLSVVAGLRYTDATHRNRSCTADTGNGDWAGVANGLIGLFTGEPGSIQPGECVTLNNEFVATFEQEKLKEDNVSWRAGMNFKPTPTSLLYGVVSRGYKAGNFPIINAIAEASTEPVVQEKITAYELGVKTGLSDVMTVNAAIYYYDYVDKQLLTNTLDPVFGLVPALGTVPDSRARGIDLDLQYAPVDGLMVRLAAAYQDTSLGEFTDFDVFGNEEQLQGGSFNFAPDWTLRSDVEYRFDLTDSLEAFVGAGATYNSGTHADLAASEELRISSHTLIDARAGLTSRDGRWEVMAWGTNIGNEKYWTNAVFGFDGLYRVMGRPAEYGLSFSYNFGAQR